MKKRTDEEKLQMINQACDLFIDAAEKIRQGKQLFHLCGIDFCGGFEEKEAEEWNSHSSNLHIYKGIKNLEAITGGKSYHPKDNITEKPDSSCKKLKYKGLVFLQNGVERTSTQAKFTFR